MGQIQILGHLHCIGPHTVQVLMRGVVLGVNCKRQSLNGAHMECANLFHMEFFNLHMALFNLNPEDALIRLQDQYEPVFATPDAIRSPPSPPGSKSPRR